MKKILSGTSGLLAPLTAFACDGPTKCVSCTLRDAPREVVQMLPGFLSTHAGLLVAIVIGAVAIGVAFRREAELTQKE